MGTLSPAARQAERNAQLRASRPGRPWLTLDTPSTVLYPAWRTRRTASAAAWADWGFTEAAIARQSMRISSRRTPASSAVRAIRRAVAARASGLSLIPCPSRARTMSPVPYFTARGSILARLSGVPLTE